MNKTVLGIFGSQNEAESVIHRLQEEGYSPKNMSIIMKDAEEAREIENNTGADVARGAVSGGTTGAVLGGILGLIASAAIPGLGTIFVGGPLAASLGLTGAAATTASGAVTGALAGGLLGALTGLGLSNDEARVYEEHIKQGGILLAVPVEEALEAHVRQTLASHGAYDVTAVSFTADHAKRSRKHAKFTDEDVDYSAHYAGAKGGRARGTRDDY